MSTQRKPRLAFWKFASCDGCQLRLLDCEDELLAVAGAIEIATRLRVTVTITGGDEEATAAVKQRLSSRHYDTFLRNVAVNLNFTEAGGWAYPDSAPVEFLIVTPPQFVADLAPFVEWKTSTGYNVSVVTTDVTGTSTTAIKSYLTGLYNGPTPPVYILMIGDSPSPPAIYTPSGGGIGGTIVVERK